MTIVGIKSPLGECHSVSNNSFTLFFVLNYCFCISVQNGDFISVYVDCSWTNSFVVSRRLYSLPIRADVEIGRGFNVSILSLVIIYNPFWDKFYRFNSFII